MGPQQQTNIISPAAFQLREIPQDHCTGAAAMKKVLGGALAMVDGVSEFPIPIASREWVQFVRDAAGTPRHVNQHEWFGRILDQILPLDWVEHRELLRAAGVSVRPSWMTGDPYAKREPLTALANKLDFSQ